VTTGKYSSANPSPMNRRFGNQPFKLIDPLVDRMRAVGTRHQKTPSQVAINYIMSKGVVPIVGVRNAAQAQENLGALGWTLSRDDVKALEKNALEGSTNHSWQHG
jgi:aryl-alcohol dehydrogenase-like predicted oxidoreductase